MAIQAALIAKSYWKQITAGLVVIGSLPFLIPLLFGGVTPGGEEEDIKRYVEVANDLNLNWKELVAFDMIRLDNDLVDADPNEAAYYFLELHYEKLEKGKEVCIKKEKGKCVEYQQSPDKVVSSEDISGKENIKAFFKKHGATSKSIAENIATINKKELQRVTSSSLTIGQAMKAAGFTKSEQEDVQAILDSGILDELYPDFANIGMMPGQCVGKVSPNGKAKANSKVKGYHDTISKYAKQFGIEPYVELLKAMMMAESHGDGGDPMQSSEASAFNTKYPTYKDGITDPDYSIYVGVQELREALKTANYDILVALQTYNFGPYFATWIKSNGGVYTVKVAQKYSDEYLYPNHGLRGTPSHASKVVNQFYDDPGCETAGGTVNPDAIGANGWAWPTKSKRITDTFISTASFRPGQVHGALDVGAITPGVAGDPVWSMADGNVSYAGLVTGGGYTVYVEHGKGVMSRYMHLDSMAVKTGQKVQKGSIVGKMGGTGGTRTRLDRNAYAVHLDFQVALFGKPVDPYPYFKGVLK